MMSILSHFHFIRPWWLLSLILLSLFLFLLQRELAVSNSWKKVVDRHLLPHLMIKEEGIRSIWPTLLAAIIGSLAIFSLAGPTWSPLPQPVFRSNIAKVILLDLSPSMLAADIEPSRLARAKYKIDDILNQYREGRTGMAVFSNESFTVSPLTNDTKTIASMVPVLFPAIMPVLGSSIGAGLKQAEKLLQQGGANRGTILLITDSYPTQEDNESAKRIHRQGYTLSVLGVGTKMGAPIPDTRDGFFNVQGKTVLAKLDSSGLKQLAESGGGRFIPFTNDDSDIKTLLGGTLGHQRFSKAEETKATTKMWKDEGHWFLLLLLPLVLTLFRRGWLEEICR